MRRLPVDLQELGLALTSDAAGWQGFLDLRTGEVLLVPVDRPGEDDAWPSDEELDAGVAAGRFLVVEPLGARVEWDWMAEFAASVPDARLRERLERALAGRGAFRRFKGALLAAPAERARWFAHRDARLDRLAREWLAARGIEPAPPARPGFA